MTENAREFYARLKHTRQTRAIEWHRRGCRHGLLKVYLTPGGWQVIGDNFRVHPDEWETRVELERVTVADHFAGKAFIPNIRRFGGFRKTLPLEPAGWPADALFTVGCDDGVTEAPLAWLGEDVSKFRTTRRRVSRTV